MIFIYRYFLREKFEERVKSLITTNRLFCATHVGSNRTQFKSIDCSRTLTVARNFSTPEASIRESELPTRIKQLPVSALYDARDARLRTKTRNCCAGKFHKKKVAVATLRRARLCRGFGHKLLKRFELKLTTIILKLTAKIWKRAMRTRGTNRGQL